MGGYPVFIASILCTAAAPAAVVDAASVKCRPDSRDASALFPDAPDMVWVLNGRVMDKEKDHGLTPETVESVFISCDAISVYDVFGIKSKRGGVFIFTKPGPKTALKASLDSLARLQQTYHARVGTFATRPADLGWSDPSGLITVDLNVATNGDRWTAIGTHRYLMYFQGPSSVMTVSGSRQEH